MDKTKTNSFPILGEDQIIQILSDLDIKISKPDLQKPTTDKVKLIFSSFYDYLKLEDLEQMRIERPNMFNDSFAVSTQEVHSNSIPLMTFYQQLKKIFDMCLYPNFKLSDILNPKKDRVIAQLSALFNFLQFREQATDFISQLLDQNKDKQINRQFIQNQYYERKQELIELQQNYKIIQPSLIDVNKNIQIQIQKLQTLLNNFTQLNTEFNTHNKQVLQVEINNKHQESLESQIDEQIKNMHKHQYSKEHLVYLQQENKRVSNEIVIQNKNQEEQSQLLQQLDSQLIKLNKQFTELFNYQDMQHIYQESYNDIQVQKEIQNQMIQEADIMRQTILDQQNEIQVNVKLYETHKVKVEPGKQTNDDNLLQKDYLARIDLKEQVMHQLNDCYNQLVQYRDQLLEKTEKIKEITGIHALHCTKLVETINDIIKTWYVQADEMARMM